MTHDQITIFLFSVAILLGLARILGEIARSLHQPAVLGEIVAGIILGPTVFGELFPQIQVAIFPSAGPNATALQVITNLSVVLFLLVAGMEVDISTIFKLRYSAIMIGLTSLVAPFAVGFGLGQTIPDIVGMEHHANQLAFSLFLGIALAISALPVIAKTLLDLKLLRTDLGMLIIAVAIFHDIVGWMVFAIVLAMMRAGEGVHAFSIPATIGLTILYAVGMLTLGRTAIHKFLPWLQAHTQWPGGILGFAVTLGLLGAAFTEFIGIHAIFGAFIVGVALGDSPHLQQKTRSTVEQFIGHVFAPIFFASIGLRVNFFAHFDLFLVLLVLVIACAGMTLGGAYGALWAGFPKRQAWAIGFGLNARGAMEIVLATLALQYHVIGNRLFVALVVMALVTSIIAGPLMQKALDRKAAARLRDFLRPQGFRPNIKHSDHHAVIGELCRTASGICGGDALALTEAVWSREQAMPTALSGGIAVPHAKIEGLKAPVVVVGTSVHGATFDAPDDIPVRLIILVLANPKHTQVHLELLADIAYLFQKPALVEQAANLTSYTEFLALVNITQAEGHEGHHRR